MKRPSLKKYTLLHVVEREYPPYLAYLFMYGMYERKRYKKLLGISAVLQVYHIHHHSYRLNTPDSQRLIRTLHHRIHEDLSYLHHVARECRRVCTDFIRWSSTIKRKDFSQASLPALRRIIHTFEEKYQNIAPFLQSFVYIDRILQEMLTSVIQKKGKDPEHDILVCSAPDEENYDYQEMCDFLRLAVAVSKKKQWMRDALIQKRIRKHAEHWGWIATRGGSKESPWTSAIITRRLVHAIRESPARTLKEFQKHRVDMRKETQRLMRRSALTKKERDLVRFVKEFLFLRTYRTDAMALGAFNCRNLFQAFGEQYGLTYWQVMMLSEKEMHDLEQRIPNKRELNRRMRAFEMIFENGETTWLHSISVPRDRIRQRSVKGVVGFRGKIRGRVAVIRDTADQEKVRRGDILVAVMTFPNLVPAMERAAAFVTDEGGILCHAAIVAREMKKPCVIGTKIATAVFLDGDVVEVNAENGIVRLLRRG